MDRRAKLLLGDSHAPLALMFVVRPKYTAEHVETSRAFPYPRESILVELERSTKLGGRYMIQFDEVFA